MSATVVFYAVDLEDLTSWVGRGDRRALEAARTALREDEEADWEPAELELLDRLLERLVMKAELYEGLEEQERYYLTQLLIDLFDEFVDSDAVSEEWPLASLEQALAPLGRSGSDTRRLAGYLTRGRVLNGDACLREGGDDLEAVLPYMGYVTRDELPSLAEALENPPREAQGRSAAAWKALANACRECVESERDLLSFVG